MKHLTTEHLTTDCNLITIDYHYCENIDFLAVVNSLSQTPRWRGFFGFYSVAEHCYRCSLEGNTIDQQLSLLFHDIFETLSGDIPTPLKKMISIGNLSFSHFERCNIDLFFKK